MEFRVGVGERSSRFVIRDKSIEVKEGGVRLDAALLLHFPTSTRAFAREAIESGAVLVDGRRAAKGLKLRGGETIEVHELAEACDNVVAPDPSVRLREVFAAFYVNRFSIAETARALNLGTHQVSYARDALKEHAYFAKFFEASQNSQK